MKRLMFLLIVATLLVTACSSGEESNLTLDTIISEYTSEGVEVDPNEKPVFQMIGAVDGVIFYLDNIKVAIYEYESAKAIKEAKEQFAPMQDWAENGKFVIETSNQQAIDTFLNVK